VSEFVVDFLPSEFRRRGVMAASRRRSVLLLGLLGAMIVGVAAHSWNRFREAESRRAVSLAITTNAANVDDVVDRLAEQQRELHRYLSVYDRLAIPVEQSDLVATITHLMPERTSLAMLRLHVKDDAPAKTGEPTKERSAKADSADKAAAKAPTRWMEVTIGGYAAGNADLYELERKLANTKPFDGVTVSENKPIDVPGSHVQEFKITCRVPLDVKYVRPGTAVAAGTKEASR
jgi:hypothetical protein